MAVYFVYTAASTAIGTRRLESDEATARVEVAQLQDRAAYLEGVREYVQSDAFVEQEARRKLGWVREGEIPFVVISPPLEDSGDASGEWWERLFPR